MMGQENAVAKPLSEMGITELSEHWKGETFEEMCLAALSLRLPHTVEVWMSLSIAMAARAGSLETLAKAARNRIS